jgi:aminoglycoside 6'-N-acetyltransferase I
MSELAIRRATGDDRDEWLRMRSALWPDCPRDRHLVEMGEALADPAGLPVFVAVRPTGGLGGFLEAGLRPWVSGCDSRPVGYLEGWYVDADLRRTGVGRRLVEAGEEWARSVGCREMASDCLIDNDVSFLAHLSIGYEEAERLIHFRKSLAPIEPE